MESTKGSYYAEITDTFGGEANYCWVKRVMFDVPENASDRAITFAAKRALGITGTRCRTVNNYGDMRRLDVVGACVCVFIGWQETEAAQ